MPRASVKMSESILESVKCRTQCDYQYSVGQYRAMYDLCILSTVTILTNLCLKTNKQAKKGSLPLFVCMCV